MFATEDRIADSDFALSPQMAEPPEPERYKQPDTVCVIELYDGAIGAIFVLTLVFESVPKFMQSLIRAALTAHLARIPAATTLPASVRAVLQVIFPVFTQLVKVGV